VSAHAQARTARPRCRPAKGLPLQVRAVRARGSLSRPSARDAVEGGAHVAKRGGQCRARQRIGARRSPGARSARAAARHAAYLRYAEGKAEDFAVARLCGRLQASGDRGGHRCEHEQCQGAVEPGSRRSGREARRPGQSALHSAQGGEMSEAACSFEAAVVDAARTGEWSAGLREHMHGCAACTESARVTAWLADAAARLGRARPAPDPTYIWLRAEIEKRAKEERASIRRRSGIAAVLALAAAGASAAAVLAALPRI